MSNALIDSLETRVNNAVQTIESLKSENLALREDRQILEDKLREILEKFEGVESSDVMTASEPNAASSPDSNRESTVESRYGLGNLGIGGNSSSSEY